ncbi:uncharacterized protein LOC105794114 isoform X2 [Gossypium raimondii]|uniref:uncharacterized protein LOC105794114 isoform X2 n=1 Tax=Gossypium raimondii TaxID=29730 RepID=UPI00227C29FA|nr:uncharacterized protein LOC105794114 isoform X2 [Gossypium raimondii]XP_052484240.1 uncharacterized protein LOC105794114 isoform X2 [Gossypium raimondii]XP_052484241.1 uncharacterized protein LOC105794114 isoform X2 [Gossypium raimondii]
MEYVAKVGNLVEASKRFATLGNIVDADVGNGTVKKQRSPSPDLHRVRQGLDLVRALFEQFLSSNMGKKGSWFSAIKKIFFPHSKEKLNNVQSTSDGTDSTLSNPLCEESAQNSSKYSNRQSIHPPPAFGSSPNLEALALEANKSKDQDGDSSLLDSSHLSRSALTDKVLSKFNFLTSEQCFTTIFS